MGVKGKAASEQVQLVVASLAGEEYGIPIMQVQEIIKYPEITHIPHMPEFVDGVTNLRGKIVPVIDLHKRFGIGVQPRTDDTRIVISSAGGQLVGLVVDAVAQVIRVARTQIDPIPPALARVGTEYLDGVCKVGERLVILLNLAMVLSEWERAALATCAPNDGAGSHEPGVVVVPNNDQVLTEGDDD